MTCILLSIWYWNWEGPCGTPRHGTKKESFLSPIFCRQDSSLHDPPWVPKGRSEQLPNKGGAERKPPEARLKAPEKLIKLRRPPETRLRECRPCTYPNLVSNSTLEPSQVGTHSFWGQEPAVSHFAWQSNKAILFYLTPNFVSLGTAVEAEISALEYIF